MRLKKVKNASERLEKSKYVVLNPESNKGKWHTVFSNSNDINIEIGMGKGDFIIGMALKYPNVNFIGIEMFDSVLVRASEKLENYNLDNLKLIRMDANYIEDIFDKEINIIYLNFSDPWPKKRHAKRRLTSENFLKKYDKVFKKEKVIYQKTDNQDLFKYSLESLSNYGYSIKNITFDLENSSIKDNIKTEYEKKFTKDGIKICRLEAYKR